MISGCHRRGRRPRPACTEPESRPFRFGRLPTRGGCGTQPPGALRLPIPQGHRTACGSGEEQMGTVSRDQIFAPFEIERCKNLIALWVSLVAAVVVSLSTRDSYERIQRVGLVESAGGAVIVRLADRTCAGRTG